MIGPTGIELNGLDLFCGAGGMTQGSKEAGFRIIAANDLSESAGRTYQRNHPDTKFVLGDVTQEAIKQKICAAFGTLRCHVALGGPECDAYSMAGLRNPDDPRAHLFRDYVEIVRRLRPLMFVMENVTGVLSMRMEGRSIPELIKGAFADIGYHVEHQTIDAADFGVAQHRRRVIFIGAIGRIPILFPLPRRPAGQYP
jgi:DNA (cytosine-5)-methyltransferase 1